MNRTYHRGDMYYADLGRGIGSEQEIFERFPAFLCRFSEGGLLMVSEYQDNL